MAVMRDADTRSGRGANFGDNMAAAHVGLGVTGALVEGTVRDLPGIQDAGLAIWAHGTVPGHGVFNLTSVRFQEMCRQPGFNYEKWKTAREI